MIIMSRWIRTKSAFVTVPDANSSVTLRSYWLSRIGLNSKTRRERISAGSIITALGMEVLLRNYAKSNDYID
jgi:hypothetical protein